MMCVSGREPGGGERRTVIKQYIIKSSDTPGAASGAAVTLFLTFSLSFPIVVSVSTSGAKPHYHGNQCK